MDCGKPFKSGGETICYNVVIKHHLESTSKYLLLTIDVFVTVCARELNCR